MVSIAFYRKILLLCDSMSRTLQISLNQNDRTNFLPTSRSTLLCVYVGFKQYDRTRFIDVGDYEVKASLATRWRWSGLMYFGVVLSIYSTIISSSLTFDGPRPILSLLRLHPLYEVCAAWSRRCWITVWGSIYFLRKCAWFSYAHFVMYVIACSNYTLDWSSLSCKRARCSLLQR